MRAKPLTLLVLSLVALGLVGCSSDGDESTATTDPGASEGAGGAWEMPAPNTEPMSEADAAAVDEAMEAAFAEMEGQTPAMWFGVWDPDKGTYLSAVGNATEPDTAATVDDHFRIGSITKTFTGAAVLAAVDDGDLALDDTIADAAPDLAEAHEELADITVEQLLTMTSGIPDYANLPLVIPEVIADPSKTWTADEIIDLVVAEEELAEPGTPGYSTTNFLILGEILEAIDGTSVEEQLEAIAADAGLTSSGFTDPGDETLPDPASSGYVNGLGAESLAGYGADVPAGTDVSDWTTTWGGAGGGMYATLADLGAWAASGFGSTALSAELGAQRMASPVVLPDGPDYGLGVAVYGDGWVGHPGQLIGWESIALANTETGLVIVGAVNETGSSIALDDVILELYPDAADAYLL